MCVFFLLHLGHRPGGCWRACPTYVFAASLRQMAPLACRSWRCVSLLYWLFAIDVRESILCFCWDSLRSAVGARFFADVIWRGCLGLYSISDSRLRCVARASPASCVYGYPARTILSNRDATYAATAGGLPCRVYGCSWFTSMPNRGVRQTTFDGLPCCVYGYPWFTGVPRRAVRQTTVDGLPCAMQLLRRLCRVGVPGWCRISSCMPHVTWCVSG